MIKNTQFVSPDLHKVVDVVYCGRIEFLRMGAMCSNQCRSLAGADLGVTEVPPSYGSCTIFMSALMRPCAMHSSSRRALA